MLDHFSKCLSSHIQRSSSWPNTAPKRAAVWPVSRILLTIDVTVLYLLITLSCEKLRQSKRPFLRQTRVCIERAFLHAGKRF
jgi:hypothetical protein